jgi:tetratricopeptide (TPR) repeat protein
MCKSGEKQKVSSSRPDCFFQRLALAGIVGLSSCMALWPLPATAHDSPEKLVNRYTALIAEHGPTPLLLHRRAAEYRVLGELEKAAVDLEQAIKLRPGFLSAWTELSRIYLAQGKTREALATVNKALGMIPREEDRPEHYMIRAEIHRVAGHYESALADCDRAFQRDVNDLDWFVIRSQLQVRLGRREAAAAGLKEGVERTGSAVLEAQWIEALIDVGQCREALERIEPQLQNSRWQSSWLLRRGRARLVLRDMNGAQEDFRKAIAEIDSRINTDHPDFTLLVDRGLAHALLGDTIFAEKDLQAARKLGAEGWLLFRLESALAGRSQASALTTGSAAR